MNEKDFERIAALIKPINDRLDRIERDISKMQEDISDTQEDISEAKEDAAEVKEDIARMRERLDIIKQDTHITRVTAKTLIDWSDKVSIVTAAKLPR